MNNAPSSACTPSANPNIHCPKHHHTQHNSPHTTQRGEASRSYGSTIMNAESSRSHTIYRLIIEINEPEGAADDGDGELMLPSEMGKERAPI